MRRDAAKRRGTTEMTNAPGDGVAPKVARSEHSTHELQQTCCAGPGSGEERIESNEAGSRWKAAAPRPIHPRARGYAQEAANFPSADVMGVSPSAAELRDQLLEWPRETRHRSAIMSRKPGYGEVGI